MSACSFSVCLIIWLLLVIPKLVLCFVCIVCAEATAKHFSMGYLKLIHYVDSNTHINTKIHFFKLSFFLNSTTIGFDLYKDIVDEHSTLKSHHCSALFSPMWDSFIHSFKTHIILIHTDHKISFEVYHTDRQTNRQTDSERE